MDAREWPPEKTDAELFDLHNHIKDYQITHGSLVKVVRTDEAHDVSSRPIGVSMYPTQFPRACFEHGLALQAAYNELYVNIAEDEEWLHGVLEGLIDSEPLIRTLWRIHEQVTSEGISQPVSLGIIRSDYMLHTKSSKDLTDLQPASLKQVELNTYSCAGGIHGNIATNMHHYLARMGCYTSRGLSCTIDDLPQCHTTNSIVDGLALAHQRYISAYKTPLHERAILMSVQPYNVNICDERPIEYGLWSQDPAIPIFRCIFSEEILDRCTLDHKTRSLLYTPLANLSKTYEISVIFMRAGYDAGEYVEFPGAAARLLLERSRAIKCPSLLSHLSTLKKVQQALCEPGVLSRFLPDASPSTLFAIRQTFMPQYALDPSTTAGKHAISLALDPKIAKTHILKPSLEGGGHNIYGADIPDFLAKTPKKTWPNYVLMERITPPEQVKSILLSPRGIYNGPVVSELGIFGTVLWRRREDEVKKGGKPAARAEIIENRGATGWSFKTKARHVDEMSVIKGYGCFDCPFLV